MPGFLDNIFVPLASSLIDKFGTSATYVRETKAYDTATGTPTVSTATYNVVIKPPETVGSSGSTRLSNRRTPPDGYIAGDLLSMIAAADLPVDQVRPESDKLIIGGTIWHIIAGSPIYSGEEIAAYDLHIRQ